MTHAGLSLLDIARKHMAETGGEWADAMAFATRQRPDLARDVRRHNSAIHDTGLANSCDTWNSRKREAAERLNKARRNWFAVGNTQAAHLRSIGRKIVDPVAISNAAPIEKTELDAATAEMRKYSLIPDMLKPMMVRQLGLGTFGDPDEFCAAVNSQTLGAMQSGQPDDDATWAALKDYHDGDEAKITQRHPELARRLGKTAVANDGNPLLTAPASQLAPPYSTSSTPAPAPRSFTPDQVKALGLSSGNDPVEVGLAADCCGGFDPGIARAKRPSILVTLTGYSMGKNRTDYNAAQRDVLARHPTLQPDTYAVPVQ